MKYMKRKKIYQSKNVTFNPETLEAYSYNWWAFVKKIDGVLVFNNYRYSVTTSKHQSKVRSLLNKLNINIDLEIPVLKGLQDYESLDQAIIDAEEYLCDDFLRQILKKQDQYQIAKRRKNIKKLTNLLEQEMHFRDYKILGESSFGRDNTIAVHQKVDMSNMEYDVSNAIENFHKDGFRQIVFYIEEK